MGLNIFSMVLIRGFSLNVWVFNISLLVLILEKLRILLMMVSRVFLFW